MSWFCDVCGDEIRSTDDGWVEWISLSDGEGRRRGRDLRLVHHRPASPLRGTLAARCQFHERNEHARDGGIVNDLPLKSFLGPDGLMRLLAMIAEERAPRDEVLEMIKRLHIPGYEQARLHFVEAVAEDVFEPNTLPGYHHGDQIQAVLEWLAQR